MAKHQQTNPARVLTEIIRFKLDNYRTPTVHQLDEQCGIHSLSKTVSSLNHLEQTGHIAMNQDGGIRIMKLNYDSPAQVVK